MFISVNSLWTHPSPLRPSFGALRLADRPSALLYQLSELLAGNEGIGAPPLVKGGLQTTSE